MAKDKVKAIVHGKMRELSTIAFEMAKEYFGAQKVSEVIASKPIELATPILIPKIKVVVEKPQELEKKPLPKEELAKATDQLSDETKVARKRTTKKK